MFHQIKHFWNKVSCLGCREGFSFYCLVINHVILNADGTLSSLSRSFLVACSDTADEPALLMQGAQILCSGDHRICGPNRFSLNANASPVFYVHPLDASIPCLCVRSLSRRKTPMKERSNIFKNFNHFIPIERNCQNHQTSKQTLVHTQRETRFELVSERLGGMHI